MIRYCPVCKRDVAGKPDQKGTMPCPICGAKTERAEKEKGNRG